MTLGGAITQSSLPLEPQRRLWDEIEWILMAAFENVFAGQPITPTVGFFDLGGDSLTALRLIAYTDDLLDVPLSIETIFEIRRIDRTAEALRAAPQGDGAPHGDGVQSPPPGNHARLRARGDGEILHASDPSPGHLAPPLAMIRSRGPDGQVAPLRSVEKIAEAHLAEVRPLADGRRFVIAGYSFGGLITLELARRCVDAGLPVVEAVLIGCGEVHRKEPPTETFLVWERLELILRHAGRVVDPAQDRTVPPTDEYLGIMLRQLQTTDYAPHEVIIDGLRACLRVYALNSIANLSYRPRDPGVPVTSVNDRDTVTDWTRKLGRPVDSVSLDVGHDELLQDERMALGWLGERLRHRDDQRRPAWPR